VVYPSHQILIETTVFSVVVLVYLSVASRALLLASHDLCPLPRCALKVRITSKLIAQPFGMLNLVVGCLGSDFSV
jgi:hypothetical protein